MYLIAIVLILLVFPLASIAVDAFHTGTADLVRLAGKWFVFWSCGVRLFLAGLRQVTKPAFTAESIFAIKDPAAGALVREIGFGNLSIGALGLASLAIPGWVVPAAIAGGLYYGLAGLGHFIRNERNAQEQIALVSDFAVFLLLAAFVLSRIVH